MATMSYLNPTQTGSVGANIGYQLSSVFGMPVVNYPSRSTLSVPGAFPGSHQSSSDGVSATQGGHWTNTTVPWTRQPTWSFGNLNASVSQNTAPPVDATTILQQSLQDLARSYASRQVAQAQTAAEYAAAQQHAVQHQVMSGAIPYESPDTVTKTRSTSNPTTRRNHPNFNKNDYIPDDQFEEWARLSGVRTAKSSAATRSNGSRWQPGGTHNGYYGANSTETSTAATSRKPPATSSYGREGIAAYDPEKIAHFDYTSAILPDRCWEQDESGKYNVKMEFVDAISLR